MLKEVDCTSFFPTSDSKALNTSIHCAFQELQNFTNWLKLNIW